MPFLPPSQQRQSKKMDFITREIHELLTFVHQLAFNRIQVPQKQATVSRQRCHYNISLPITFPNAGKFLHFFIARFSTTKDSITLKSDAAMRDTALLLLHHFPNNVSRF